MTSIEEQIDQFEHCGGAFAASVAALDESLFLRKVNGWTQRDIVAHLKDGTVTESAGDSRHRTVSGIQSCKDATSLKAHLQPE